MSQRRRRRVEPTDEWKQLKLLCGWPEQVRYKQIRPLVLFGSPAAERVGEVGPSERTLYRRAARFDEKGMESLFDAQAATHKKLPASLRCLILDLKAEYPRFSLNEIAKVCYVRFGRLPSRHTVKKVLQEERVRLRMVRCYLPYHEIAEPRGRRLAVVRLHAEGWTVKAIAGCLKVDRDTVYRALKRWNEEGEAGLEDRPLGRPKGVRKVTLAAMDAVRRLQRNPGLGEFRVHAALKQIGIHLSPRTVGRILALNRELYGLEKPKGSPRQAKAMPFASSRRHRYWAADVGYLDAVDEHLVGCRAYAITVLENHSRAVLASAVSPTQDLQAFLSVLYSAEERYGSPEALVTDGGSVFKANQACAIDGAWGIDKDEVECGGPWQSYVETTFNIQRRMADWHFGKAESWPELVAAHDAWVEDYNAQAYWAHRERQDGRRSPQDVLGWLAGIRYRPEDLERAFFSTRFTSKLDALGYATFRCWRLYGEEGMAGKEAAVWLQEQSLRLEYRGETLSRYDVEDVRGADRLEDVGRPRLYETPHAPPQPKLFWLDALGEIGWPKALRLERYAPRHPRGSSALQEVLFPFLDAS